MIRPSFLSGLSMLLSLSALAGEADPIMYGRYEHIYLEDLGKTLKAKMDTGAMTASLSAKDIEYFQRDGEYWVRFRLAVEGHEATFYEHPLVRVSQIKMRAEEQAEEDGDEERGSESMRRPVISMELCIGNQRQSIEVNLTNRSHFSYPLLIGARAIRQLGAVINPARQYMAGRPHC